MAIADCCPLANTHTHAHTYIEREAHRLGCPGKATFARIMTRRIIFTSVRVCAYVCAVDAAIVAKVEIMLHGIYVVVWIYVGAFQLPLTLAGQLRYLPLWFSIHILLRFPSLSQCFSLLFFFLRFPMVFNGFSPMLRQMKEIQL